MLTAYEKLRAWLDPRFEFPRERPNYNRTAPYKYPFRDMEIGDVYEGDMKAVHSANKAPQYFGYRFVCRRKGTENIWRIKRVA